MAQSIQALRERRNALAKEVRNLLDNNTGANWKPEHQTEYDAKMAEVERVDAEIAREQKLIDLTAENNLADIAKNGKKGAGKNGGNGEGDEDVPRALLNKWLRGGDNALNADEWATVRATMSTTTPSEGGYTVQSEVASEMITAMKAFGGMRDVATEFSTSAGNPMNWPTMDDTGNVGELIAENTAATDQDASFGTVAMNVYKFSSKIVTIPIELLQDSLLNLDAIVFALLAERLARVQNTYFTTGTGTNQPRGIVTGATLGKTGTTGQTGTVIYDDLVDLEHSVDPAYRNRPGTGFMMHDSSIKVIRKIKDSEGRPIFVPGYEVGTPGGAPASLLNRPITVNQDVATMAANAKSILFGNLANYRIRNVMAATLFRFTDSAFTKKGQVGYLAWQRSGGNLLDNSGATVKYYANSAT
jgi:HK97 family phage major capsid protein